MIKCSTCACLVPLLELCDHVCKPEVAVAAARPPPAQLQQRRPLQTRQYSADVQYAANAPTQQYSRAAPHSLRLNVNHAQGLMPVGPGELLQGISASG